MSYSNTHHSYCVELAIELKDRDKAIIIHHLQYWIKINRRKKSKNHFHENHWWMYQTINDFCATLPEFTPDSIIHHLNALVEKKIIIKGNFNKLKLDKTCWYAFVDEEKFLGPDDSNNDYERGKPPSNGDSPDPEPRNPIPIPDPISSDPKATDTKKDLTSSSQLKKKETNASAQASALGEEFYFALKDAHGEAFIKPNLEKWAKDFDLLLRIDKTEPSLIRKVMNWAVNDSFWKSNILSPSKLRKQFLTLKIQMERPKFETKKSMKSQEAKWTRQERDIPAENDILAQLLAK